MGRAEKESKGNLMKTENLLDGIGIGESVTLKEKFGNMTNLKIDGIMKIAGELMLFLKTAIIIGILMAMEKEIMMMMISMVMEF